MIVLNLKVYKESVEKALFYVDVASEVVEASGLRIIVAPPSLYLKEAAERFSDVFAQHCDNADLGAKTGYLPVEALKLVKARGSILNHSEHKLRPEEVKETIEKLHNVGLESLACAADLSEVEKIALFSPAYIAVEPPELIGGWISVSKAKPEIVEQSVKRIKDTNSHIKALCGAGISSKDDVQKALALGADGVLLASAFVKATDPREFLAELASAF